MTWQVVAVPRRMRLADGMDPTKLVQDAMPLCHTLDITASAVDRERAVLHLDWAPGLCTTAGALHGGVLMALADSAGAACAYANLPEGAAGTTTLESKTNLVRAVREGQVTATATPLHNGRTTMVIETEVRDATGRLVAKTTQTQAVLKG